MITGYSIKVSSGKPSDRKRWDQIATENAQFWASTCFDQIQDIYHKTPYYFEMFIDNTTMGGIKVYVSNYKRLKYISNRIFREAFIQGEIILDKKFSIDHLQVKKIFESFLIYWFRKQNIVSVKVSPFNGNNELMPVFGKIQLEKRFNLLHINLNQPMDEIFDKFHPKHRNLIRKAEKTGIRITEDYKPEMFYEQLLKQTYSGQEHKPTDKRFILAFCESAKNYGYLKMYFAWHNDTLLSGALVLVFGDYGDYSFGGNVKNNLGAGILLQWHIMKDLKIRGVATYSLGQTADGYDTENEKFSVGISKFKRRFGGKELPVWSGCFVFKPILKAMKEGLLKVFLNPK
ncbi:MAG TPA: GNAT family N-acetyltransferase [Bacteroidales bacterium]|nr:GNAT family N-acetyltransferase [Bacteroidales bacterium]HQP04406.1 GNAT family N-acetyltransferase [Bacteroidales bacterium]